jgi:polysaccharide biosynthesis transport protein
MITWAEITTFLRMLWRWAWVIVLAVVLSTVTALIISQYQRSYYITRVSLMIGNAFESQRPDANSVQLANSLGTFYAELARRERILKPVQENLGLKFPWQIIADEMMRTNVVGNAGLLEIYITDTSPERAAALANSIADQLISYSPTAPDKVQAERAVIEEQIRNSSAQIELLKQRITETTIRQQQTTSASDLSELNAQLTQLQNSLANEQERYNALLEVKSSSVVNSLSVFEAAQVPSQPLPSRRILTVAIAAMLGFLVSVLAIVILDRLDSRWRGSRDVAERFSFRLLGDIEKSAPILASLAPQSIARHTAVRGVHSNLLLAAGELGIHTLVVTSPHASLDRTALTIDISLLFARSGQRVLLVDADPIVGELSRSLHASDDARPWSAIGRETNRILANLSPTPIPNVALLPVNGDVIGQPSMLSSPRWRELVRSLAGIVDVVIFDGPSVLSGPDAALLAPHVDGVVLVLDPSTDNRQDVDASRTMLQKQADIRLLGAVTLRPGSLDATTWRLPDHRNPELPGFGLATTDTIPGATITPTYTTVNEHAREPEPTIIVTPNANEDDGYLNGQAAPPPPSRSARVGRRRRDQRKTR